jgi:hypothetical protein
MPSSSANHPHKGRRFSVMNNHRNMIETLKALVFLCQYLAEKGVPVFAWTEPEDGSSPEPCGNWTATVCAVRDHLGRRLTDAEVTLVSLTRGWGPLPWFSGEWRHPLILEIWSSPNHLGGWLEWEEMGEILQYLLERELFEESLFLELETT